MTEKAIEGSIPNPRERCSMKPKTVDFCAVGLACLLFVGGARALAHHSEAAQFDPEDPVAVEGVVVKVEWANPHIWYYVDVTDENGEVTTWGFSGLPPGVLPSRSR